MIELGSAAFGSLSKTASGLWHQLRVISQVKNRECKHIPGDVGAVIFDFDGTLTSTPGDRADRRSKINELKERAAMLSPWLRSLRSADLTLGILSKSTTDTLTAALEAAGLRDVFNGPVHGKAVGFEGKAGFIRDYCAQGGALGGLGPEGLKRVLLVDDDLTELVRAREFGIQTYPAPKDGGLQAEHFDEIFGALKIAQLAETQDVNCIWARGYIADGLGIPASSPPKHEFHGDRKLCFCDHYDVDEQMRLGQGSFGYIRPGVHKRTGRKIAVKFVRRSAAGKLYLQTFVDGEMWTFLLRMSLEHSHSNVLTYFDFFTGPTILYTIMEELRGEDLLVYLKKRSPITEASSQSMIFQLLSALEHVHGVMDQGIIHRDVKLENLRFRTPASDTLVLVDFGLCCAAQPNVKRKVVGTLPYMAPEIFGRWYSTQVDMWSTGALLNIILSGKMPWQGNPFEQAQDPVSETRCVDAAIEACEAMHAPALAVDLLASLLVIDPRRRLTATDAMQHGWLSGSASKAIGSGEGPVLEAKLDQFSSPRSMEMKASSSATGSTSPTRGVSSTRDPSDATSVSSRTPFTLQVDEVPYSSGRWGGLGFFCKCETQHRASLLDVPVEAPSSPWWPYCSPNKGSPGLRVSI